MSNLISSNIFLTFPTFLTFATFSTFFSSTKSFSDGAPESACFNMTPEHDVDPQSGEKIFKRSKNYVENG